MLHTNLCTIRLYSVLVTGKMSLQKTFIASSLIVSFSYKSTWLEIFVHRKNNKCEMGTVERGYLRKPVREEVEERLHDIVA